MIRYEKHSWGYFATNGKKVVAVVSRSPQALKRAIRSLKGRKRG